MAAASGRQLGPRRGGHTVDGQILHDALVCIYIYTHVICACVFVCQCLCCSDSKDSVYKAMQDFYRQQIVALP